MKAHKVSALQVSVLIASSLLLISLTFKSFFFYVPFANGFSVLGLFQSIALLGFVSLIAAPPLFFASSSNWGRAKFALFAASVSLWTLGTLLIKVYGLITAGKLWANYLLVYPVMIYFEWIAPVFYIFLGLAFYRSSKGTKQLKRKVIYVEEEVAPEPHSDEALTPEK